ncbi:MarR family winged helix-turn-helix transcriptional regulator [Chengkuizengella sediminis]|uniref:MarR family winged helix-turn-helix transcriptional regulator n=1 Tax=Chengkuizengella sediminis TaxID=1885917 RepID=UPI0013898DC7|nr:MarR family transcriptional regulator [Chengkuizengella sediminis]NDI34938.1 helix-turn-helix domain-containing protein [Chengkuizengella sediminis]
MDNQTLFNKLITFTSSVHRVTNELTKDAKPELITQLQYDIIDFIAVNQPVTLSEISDCIRISMPNASRELRKLGEHHLIDKKSDVEDRRKQFIYLSKEGEMIIDKAYKQIEFNFNNRMNDASEMDLEEIELAIDILQRKLYFD